MQIGETIRKYRKEKNLTQEEMANRLGVTPPAVNKWENGNCYPDITMLAPIARLLDISLDTLLTFQGELTEEEIKNIVQEVDLTFKEGTFEEAYELIRDYLKKYPGSGQLIWQLAMILDARSIFTEVRDREKYEPFVEECYLRALESKDGDLRNRAADSLYSFYVRKEEYAKAEKYLEYFPERDPERKRKQAAIYSKTGRTEEAYKAYEELLFADYQMVSMVLHGLYMLAVKEGDMERAHLFVDKQADLARLFDMGPYYEESGRVDLASLEKDEKTMLETARVMLSGIGSIRDFTKSVLYGHMEFKEAEQEFIKEMQRNLLKAFKEEEDFGFMKDNREWRKLLKEYE